MYFLDNFHRLFQLFVVLFLWVVLWLEFLLNQLRLLVLQIIDLFQHWLVVLDPVWFIDLSKFVVLTFYSSFLLLFVGAIWRFLFQMVDVSLVRFEDFFSTEGAPKICYRFRWFYNISNIDHVFFTCFNQMGELMYLTKGFTCFSFKWERLFY